MKLSRLVAFILTLVFAVSGLAADKPVEVDTAEAMSITFPNFVELMTQCGGKVRMQKGE